MGPSSSKMGALFQIFCAKLRLCEEGLCTKSHLLLCGPRLFVQSREDGNHQNNSFNANWIWRDVVAVLVITPAEEL